MSEANKTDPQMLATAAANIADLLAPLKPEMRSMAIKMAEMMMLPVKQKATRSDKGTKRKKVDEVEGLPFGAVQS